MTKSHARAPDKLQTSIAVPKTVMDKLDRMAEETHRSRNNLIAHFLIEAVKEEEKRLAEEGQE